jgi:8-oxo-dGTP pyrophosphatase MutT (NUDIX family)
MEGSLLQYRVRPAAIIKDDRGRLLAVRHARRGMRFWTLPGGASNIGESLEQTLEREVSEETGYRVRVMYMAAVFEIGSSPWETRRLELCFRCSIVGKDPALICTRDNIVEIGWLDPSLSRSDFLPSTILPLLTEEFRGLYLGNITDVEHPLAR